MAKQQIKNNNLVRDVCFRIAKATLKAIIVYLLYFFLMPMLAPLFEIIPGFLESIEAFVAIYIVLMILSDLTAKTVFQYFFKTSRSLFFVGYMILSMGNGVFSTSYESFSLTINLTLFYAILATLSLLGLARTILQTIEFIHKKSEISSNLQN